MYWKACLAIQTAVSSSPIMSLYENFTRSRLASNTYAISLSISFSGSFWDSVVLCPMHNPCLVMNFCTHPMLAVNVGGSSMSLHFSSWRNLALLLIIFLYKRKPLERRSWTHSNNISSISRSKGFLPAPASRFRLQLAASNLLWFTRHSRILFRSTLNHVFTQSDHCTQLDTCKNGFRIASERDCLKLLMIHRM